jgi:phenylacetic acid degradation operon negative regulatory protein
MPSSPLTKSSEFEQRLQKLICNFSQCRPVRANSLLITLFGDSICPHGGTVWLGSLIKLVEPLGINQRLVRTSVFRLTQNNILRSEQVGRRSYYSLTEQGLRQFATVSMRIYNDRRPNWDGQWRLVFTALADITQEERDNIRHELQWLGFGRLAPGVFGHPTADLAPVHTLVRELGLENKVAMMLANTQDDGYSCTPSSILVKQCFQVKPMDAAYSDFLKLFEPLLKSAKQAKNLDPHLCFMLRTLLIHKFRRILLSEPELPFELLPEDSAGHKAWQITQALYSLIAEPAETYLMSTCETQNGPLPKASSDYQHRFGGMNDRVI